MTEKSEENQLSKFAEMITQYSTLLLMVSVILFFVRNLYVIAMDPLTGEWDFILLGSAAMARENLIVLQDMGPLFAVFDSLFAALVILLAGLSFAAVCFDENKNIWFRVVSVAALMLIMYGGLNIM